LLPYGVVIKEIIMRKFALPITLAAAAGLAACASPDTQTRSSAAGGPPMVASAAKESSVDYRPGMGVVESVSRTPALSSAAGAGAPVRSSTSTVGASGAPVTSSGEPMYRLAIRMEDGRIQFVDTDENYTVGTRVELLPEKYIRRQ
jgi:hypothetical protein